MSLSFKFGLVVTAFWAAIACADPNYGGNSAAQLVIDELVRDEGFERAQLEALFSSAQRKDSIIQAMSRPAEKTKQ